MKLHANLQNLKQLHARKSQAINMIQQKEKNVEHIDYITSFMKLLPEFSYFMKGKEMYIQQKICNQIQYQCFPDDHLLFRKGDIGDAFYTILSGSVVLFDGDIKNQQDWKIINVLETGRSFGEKAIETEQGRMCHAICRGQTEFLTLTKASYKELLSQDTQQAKEKKLKFIDQSLPNSITLGKSLKEKVMFMLHIKKAQKKEKILVEGEFSDALFFISEGECKVLNESKINSPNQFREFIILSKGSFFGEESIFQDIACPFSVIVSSNTAELMYIKKTEIRYLPEQVLNQIKANFQQKINQRQKRKITFRKILLKQKEDNGDKCMIENMFRSANKLALKSIYHMVQKRNKKLINQEDTDTQ